MAELIYKGALLETVKQEKQTLQGNIYRAAVCMVEDKIKRMPTTTESEIRAKAYDRFLTEMLNEFDSRYADIEEHTGSYVVSRLLAVADQLKEEQ